MSATVDKPLVDPARYPRRPDRPARVPTPPSPRRAATGMKAKLVFAALGAILLAYAISLVVRDTGATSTAVDGWGVAAFEMLVSCLVVIRGAVTPRDRAFGLWLGLGMAAWATGDTAMTAETLHGATPPALSLANVLWYGFFPLAYIGVMALMRRDVRRFTTANYLDGVVACLVTGAVFAAFAFDPIAKASGAGTDSTAVNVIYPVGDLLLLVLVAIPIRLLPPGKRARWGLLVAACLVNAAGDIAAVFPGIVATHVGFFLNSFAWPASLYLIAAAIWLAGSTTDAARPDNTNGFAVPSLAGGVALIVLFVGSLDHASNVALAFASATILAAGVRFGLALRRLRSLTDDRHRQLSDAAEAEQASRRMLQEAAHAYSAFAARVADGDLTATLPADDNRELHELATSLNRMVAGLAEISGAIQAGVGEMSSSTAEILAAVRDHTENAGQQSAAIQQTSVTVDQLRAGADLISAKAGEVASRARASLRVSDEGSSAVAAISEAMNDIRSRVDGIARDIDTLSERTQQIGEITDTVKGLAERSNLLALNASIEAARAGEHGKGFAVVAEQVRHLAEQSSEATAQVETILADISAATTAAVSASEQGTQVVARGLELAVSAGEGIRSLTETIRAASDSAEDIAASVEQQSAGMTQIALAMQEISAGTGHFVDGARQSEEAAESLEALSRQLAGLADRYRV